MSNSPVKVHKALDKKEKWDISYLVHDEKRIHGFFLDYRWLSNFHLGPIKYDGLNYPSVEHAYQAAKYPKDKRRECYFLTCASVRKWGQLGPINIQNWEETKLLVMETLQRLKFENPDLKQLLKGTKERDLCELNHWMDNFWGSDYRTPELGQNNLGKIIMKIRAGL